MQISKEIEIDLGHRIPNHKSKCRNFHGHRYRFKATVEGELITTHNDSSQGMVIDFGDLKTCMVKIIDEPLDHGFMMYIDDEFSPLFSDLKQAEGQKIIFVDFIPTVENIAQYIFTKLSKTLESLGIDLVKLEVWETPTSMAIVRKEL